MRMPIKSPESERRVLWGGFGRELWRVRRWWRTSIGLLLVEVLVPEEIYGGRLIGVGCIR